MFDSALELISQAASNSLFVFCCCNLIIVMILMGSKPGSSFQRGRESYIPEVTNTCRNGNQAQGTNNYCMHSVDEKVKRVVDVKEVSNAEEEQEPAADEEEESISIGIANDNKEDDEFRRRVEEFIHKVNSGWKAELLRTLV